MSPETITTVALVPTHWRHRLKILLMMICASPALALVLFVMLTNPDLESWLRGGIGARSRPDAFQGVNKVAPSFTVLYCTTTACVVVSILRKHYKYIVSLTAGPVLITGADLLLSDLSDPSWFLILAGNEIGMVVGVLVTGAWATLDWWDKIKPYKQR